MNIMVLSFFTVVNSAGGAARVFCNMANHFSNQGHSVYCVCNDRDKGEPFYPLNKNCTFINLDGSGKKKKTPGNIKVKTEIIRVINQLGGHYELPKKRWKRQLTQPKLRAYIKQQQTDCIICYDLDAILTVAELGFPTSNIIYMVHVNPGKLLQSIGRYEKNILTSLGHIQVLLPKDVDIFKKQGLSNAVCIGNVVPQYKMGISTQRERKILNISRIERHKGQDKLILAFAKIAEKYPDWIVEIWGGDDDAGDYTTYLQQLIKEHHVERQVFLKGRTTEVESVLATGSIFAFPSDLEGFGLALAEAMASGLPGVGYKTCNGVNELIINGKNGMLCEDGIEDFSQKLELLIQNEELREKLGNNAHESMKQYAPELIWQQWDTLVRKIN